MRTVVPGCAATLQPRSMTFRIAELLPTTFWKASAGMRAAPTDVSGSAALMGARDLIVVSYIKCKKMGRLAPVPVLRNQTSAQGEVPEGRYSYSRECSNIGLAPCKSKIHM